MYLTTDITIKCELYDKQLPWLTTRYLNWNNIYYYWLLAQYLRQAPNKFNIWVRRKESLLTELLWRHNTNGVKHSLIDWDSNNRWIIYCKLLD